MSQHADEARTVARVDATAVAGEGADAASALPQLLRFWRAQTGRKLGLDKPLTQADVAAEIGASVRWYRDIERGTTTRLSPSVAGRLSKVLSLGPDERLALHGFVTREGLARQNSCNVDLSTLQGLLEMQATNPAYCSDGLWNVVAWNHAMAEWFPWVHMPGANLMRWALTSREAREQLADWPKQAATYLAQLRFELVGGSDSPDLSALLDEILRDPECRRLWEHEPNVVAYGDNRRFRLRIPRFENRPVEAVSHVLIPAYHGELRFVIIARTDEESSYLAER